MVALQTGLCLGNIGNKACFEIGYLVYQLEVFQGKVDTFKLRI